VLAARRFATPIFDRSECEEGKLIKGREEEKKEGEAEGTF
jgi:hypothetical protein